VISVETLARDRAIQALSDETFYRRITLAPYSTIFSPVFNRT
jgi:hypothetical protein